MSRKNMTCLEDIQRNTSEFNISFHLKNFIGEAMIQVFGFKPNKDKIEEVMRTEMEPSGIKSIIIGNMFNDIVESYLAQSFYEEEMEDGENE